MIIGGLRFVTNGDNSRHGDVSRDEAVLEPPPAPPIALYIGILPHGDCTNCGSDFSKSPGSKVVLLSPADASSVAVQNNRIWHLFYFCSNSFKKFQCNYLPDETSRDRPSADALFITDRDRCLAPVGKPGTGGVFNGDDSVSWLKLIKGNDMIII